MNTHNPDTVIQEAGFSPDETFVNAEADRNELISILRELSAHHDIPRSTIEIIERLRPKALAMLLYRSAALKPSQRRCEITGGEIIRIKLKPPQQKTLPGDLTITIPKHFKVYMKAHKDFLDTLKGVFSEEMLNG